MNFQDNSHHRWHSHCPSIQSTIYSMKDAEKCLDHCRELADFVSVFFLPSSLRVGLQREDPQRRQQRPTA